MNEAGKSLLATALAHFTNDGSLNILPVLYLFLVESYGLSHLEVGVLASMTSVFAVVASPFIGRRSDSSQNYGYLMTLGLILIGIGTITYSISVLFLNNVSLFVFLLAVTLFFGIGSSFYHPLGAAILNETWSAPVRARAMGINGSLGAVGVAIFPVATNALVLSYGTPSVALLGFVAIFIAFVIFWIMRSFDFSNLRRNGPSNLRERTRTRAVGLKSILPLMIPLTVVAFLRGLTQGIVQFLPIYLQTVKSVSIANIGVAFAVMSILGIVSQPVFGFLSDKFGRRLSILISALGMAISSLLFLSIQNFVISEIFLSLFGLFNYTSFPLIMGLATEISPEGSTTIGGSIVWGVGTVGGGAVGPLLVPLLAFPAMLGSLSSAFYAVTILSLSSVLFLPFVRSPSLIRKSTATNG